MAGGTKPKERVGVSDAPDRHFAAAVEASDGRHLFQKYGNLVVSGMDGRGERVAF
jgi:hypothetical protein